MIWSSRQRVSFDVDAAQLVMKYEVVVCEFGNPKRLPTIKFLGCPEVREVLVVGPNLKVD